ncbi:AAA family ATPase [Guptibacillus hwajinpoensis]|uniref:Nuclease SbcCD subunit C n=1 Tax=Guptibacillus hwajinpoensis TaxID=208199 RepID=A0ABU0K5A8_9BACL|nr:SbcC/MukB-like Walker B domain-containing protein [Alkalihalobacillus hemicentroti]MDQ0483489.1 exonuclease SbcC [Alkalihalobacillus hemicentroti]
MKPIHLSVSGLHSFREKQEVDFETLCQGGIFGIFGPTGSGKSSLLDAMTLALYGKVERATNNTQGIMNHAEDTLFVSFTFKLGSDLTYRVERSYKRSGDISIRSANSRLIEIGEENTVLADKDRDVSQKIQEILGLTIDDFTRAVVLPQGKFAEFLSLKGTERRQMLQRLFQLEKYGDQFNRRLRARVDEKRNQVNEITAEQTGLGEASKQHLKEARESLSLAEKAAEEARVNLMQAEKQKEDVNETWSLQQQLAQIKLKRDSLVEKSDEMKELQTKLKEAQAALQIKPYLDAVESTEKEAKEAYNRYKEAKVQLDAASETYRSRKKTYEDSRLKQQEQEPILMKRLNELERGITLEKELARLKEQSTNHEEQRIALQKDIAVANDQKEKVEKDLSKARTLQSDLNEELTSLQVSPDERKRISRAQSLKQEWYSITNQLNDVNKEEKERLTERDRLYPLHEEMSKQLDKTKEYYQRYFGSLLTVYNQVSSCKLSLEKRIAKRQERVQNAHQKLEESRTHAIAIRLASELKEGESCPVCGSKDHVHLAEGDDESLKWQDHIQTDEQKREALKDQLQNANQLQYKLEQLSDLMTEQEDLSGVQQEEDHPKELRADLTDDEVITEIKSLTQDVQELEDKIKKESRSLQEHQSKASEYAYQLKQVQENLASRVEKRKQLTTQSEKIEKTLQNEFQLQIEDVESELKKIEEMDEKAIVVRDRLTKSDPYIEKQENRLISLQEQVQQYSVRNAELTSSLEQLSDQVKRAESEYEAIACDSTAQEGYNLVNKQIESLRNDEKASAVQLKEAEERYLETERQAAVAKNYDQDVQLRLKKAETAYVEAEKDSIFTDRKQVRLAEVSIDQKREWEEQVERYTKEWNQTDHNKNEVESKLSGRKVTENEYKELNKKAELAKEAREEALSHFATRRHHLEDVLGRHERFNELEEIRKTTSAELEKLGKLQTVFRGNSFVEFIASEQLEQVSLDASQKLGDLTSQRYAIEVDSSGGFLIRDDANGGVRRPVSTLSGGETFLTSLALALALSGQIQLRGAHPLQFFFLDEGFGTLDESLLDTVITSLEKLQNDSLAVGVISHVPELRARLPRKVIVSPSEPSGRGSNIMMETL